MTIESSEQVLAWALKYEVKPMLMFAYALRATSFMSSPKYREMLLDALNAVIEEQIEMIG